MTPSSWITPKAAKGIDSAIAGRGLVATEAIGKDEVVAVKGGHIVSTARLRSLSDRLRNSEIQITDDLHLAALANRPSTETRKVERDIDWASLLRDSVTD